MWKSTDFKDSIPTGVWLETKVVDHRGIGSNFRTMRYDRGLWWTLEDFGDWPEKYYRPTHYKEIN